MMVPLDGSEFATRAIPVARGIMRQVGGRILPVTARWDGDVTAARDYLAQIATDSTTPPWTRS